MSDQPRVLIDCDGPLADFVLHLRNALALRGHIYAHDDIRHWDLSLSLSPEAAAEVDTILRVPGFWSSIPAMPYASRLVQWLHVDMGCEVVCVTSPYPTPRFFLERPAWLARLGITNDDTMMVRGPRKPLIGGDVLIEDHPGTAAAWLDANPKGVAILVDRPWNTPAAKEWAAHLRMYRTPDEYLFDMLRSML